MFWYYIPNIISKLTLSRESFQPIACISLASVTTPLKSMDTLMNQLHNPFDYAGAAHFSYGNVLESNQKSLKPMTSHYLQSFIKMTCFEVIVLDSTFIVFRFLKQFLRRHIIEKDYICMMAFYVHFKKYKWTYIHQPLCISWHSIQHLCVSDVKISFILNSIFKWHWASVHSSISSYIQL